MEQNTVRPIIVEFNGLPGSGKSTTAEFLKDSLEKKGVKVLTRYVKRTIDNRAYTLLVRPKYWKGALLLIKYCKHLPLRERVFYTFSILGFSRMYADFVEDNQSGVLLIDQGIVQSFISISFNGYLHKIEDIKKILQAICFEKLPIIVVNCDISIQESSRRIVSRPPKHCRVEILHEDERQEILWTQKNNFDVIRKVVSDPELGIRLINVDTLHRIEDNVYLIMDEIRKNIRK